jgi:uncharacterized membrane protein
MIIKDFSHLSKIEKFIYADTWPDYMFVNQYPLIGVFWNLLLLAVPYFLCFLLDGLRRKNHLVKFYQKIFAILIFIVWLLFIPNSAYIVTDARHIMGICNQPTFYRVCISSAWMIMFFFIYATIGWISFVLLLNQMKIFIAKIFSEKTARLFIVIIIPLLSLGVLLGLINRWNSWEIFFDGGKIFKSAWLYFSSWKYFANWLAFTISFYFLYYLGNFLFRKKFK